MSLPRPAPAPAPTPAPAAVNASTVDDAAYERLLAAERAARAQAEQARAEAVAAAQAKSAFLATMSHELRTPLNAIIGYAELLDLGIFGAVTEGQHAHLERLRASARHLLGLVSDVLDLAKIDAGRLEVRREPAVTGTALAAALALVQPQATAKGIRIFDRHAGESGVRYLGDEHRVQQILVNLLSNAVKFTPPGGLVTIDCRIEEAPDPAVLPPDSPVHAGGPWSCVCVDDTGPGISPAFLGRLFEPFVQEEGSYTRAHGGTGLGLSISRRLARLMGGDLTVAAASTPAGTPGAAGGASFTLWLPADVPAALTAQQAAAAEATPPGGTIAVRASTPTPLSGPAYAVVHTLGLALARMAEPVAERYLLHLRASVPGPGDAGHGRPSPAAHLTDAQLRDHATPFVALVASQLMTLGEMRGHAADLLGDSARVQRFMAELHGAQRRRLGWTRERLEGDFVLLGDEAEHALRAAVDEAATAGAAPGGESLDAGSDPAAREAGLRYAVEVSRHILERAKRASVRAFEAAATDGLAGRPPA